MKHPALTGYKPTPTAPNSDATAVNLPLGYTRLSNLSASKWVWDLLWLASDAASKAGEARPMNSLTAQQTHTNPRAPT